MNKILTVRPLALVAVVAAAAMSTSALAQSTVGTVFGIAPAGFEVSAHSTTNGTQRTVHVGADGRYALRALPTGVYDVTLEENGHAMIRHPKVPVIVGRGIKVDFDCPKGDCTKAANPS
ncbi:MAG: carboxypeptidase-like regulatory domain-containing protein [Pseudomonadota bacterium]